MQKTRYKWNERQPQDGKKKKNAAQPQTRTLLIFAVIRR